MQIIEVLYNQELADVVDEEQLFEAADINGISITEALVPGVALTVPDRKFHKIMDEVVAPRQKVAVTKSEYGQTWVDLVLQQLGDEERLFELCDTNTAGITDDVIPGTVIQSPDFDQDKKSIVNVLKVNKPASDKVLAPGAIPEEGIEFWGIEFDFVVN